MQFLFHKQSSKKFIRVYLSIFPKKSVFGTADESSSLLVMETYISIETMLLFKVLVFFMSSFTKWSKTFGDALSGTCEFILKLCYVVQ